MERMLAETPNKDEGMFRGERQGRKQQTQGIIYALLGGFFVLSTVWCLFFSGWFDVKKYEINDLRVLGRDAVRGEIDGYFQQNRHWPWGSRNIFVLDTKDLEKFLLKKIFVNGVTVDKSYPNILRLKIWERQRSVVLVTNNQIYVVDDYGVITDLADDATVSTTKKYLTSTTPIETSKEIYVFLPTSTLMVKGQELFASERVRGLLDLSAKLRDAGIWFKTLDIQYDDPGALSIILKQDKRVLFDLDESVDAQIETLRSYIASKPKWEDIKEYIDVRVPGRIYYK